MVPEQVQPGAAADLEHAQRQALRGRDGEKSAQQRAAASHLVGLHVAVERGTQHRRMRLDDVQERLPRRRPHGLAAGGRKVTRQLGHRTVEDQAMHAPHQTQHHRVGNRKPGPPVEHARHRTAALDVVGRARQQLRIPRRAHGGAELRLQAERLDHAVGEHEDRETTDGRR